MPPMLIIIGVILLVIEAFIPDFGIMGVLGTACVITGIALNSATMLEAIIMSVLALIVICAFGIFVIKVMGKKVVLSQKENVEEGYTALRNDLSLVGKIGVALTDLKPSGAMDLDGQRIDVVAKGEYITKGSKIKIVDINGRMIIVKEEI